MNIIRFAVSAIVFLGVLEASARVEDALRWGAPVIGPYSHEGLWLREPLGVRNRPNYRFQKWQINSHGFRGPEIDTAKRAGVLRIGVLGASETFGLFESEDMEYPAQLRRFLEAAYPGRTEVINFGVAAMSMPAAREYFDRIIRPYHPDVVVYYPSPSFYLSEVAPGTDPPHVIQDDEIRGGFRILPKARTRLKQFVPRPLQTAVNEFAIGRVRQRHEPDWVWDEIPADRVELFTKHLTDLVDAFQEAGAMVVLLTHANMFSGAVDSLSNDQHYHLVAINKIFPRASASALVSVDSITNDALRSVAATTGSAVVDITRGIGDVPGIFADYAHFTDDGATAVARQLAEALGPIVSGAITPMVAGT